jgi:photosystem II stability/assembly factor-like uncharacterized protein
MKIKSFGLRNRKVKTIITLLFMSALIYRCDENTNMQDNSPEWQFLGLKGKNIIKLRLYKPYLYACAGSDGLWRKDIQLEYSNWEYVGLSDTTLAQELNRGVVDIVVNLENVDEILVAFFPDSGRAHGIFKTEDGGDTWLASDSGLEFHFPPPWNDETYYEYPTVFLQTPYDLFAAGTKLAHSNDFGDSWEVIMPIVGPVPTAWTYSLRYHRENTNVLWIGGQSVYFSPILLFSTDSGVTWEHIYLDTIVSVDNTVYSIAFDPNDSDVIYVSLFKEIIKTTDGGTTWVVPLMSYNGSGHVRCILEDDSRSGHLFAAAGHTTLESQNGGVSWIDLESPNESEILTMVFDSDESALYIGTAKGSVPSGVFVYK